MFLIPVGGKTNHGLHLMEKTTFKLMNQLVELVFNCQWLYNS